MTAYSRRCCSIVAVGTIVTSLAVVSTGIAQADTTYYYQGTGPTVEVSQEDRDSADEYISMSTDFGWKAEFSPAYGKQTMDQSVNNGKELGLNAVAQDLSEGKSVKLEGFSLGAVAADDIARDLDTQGVDMSNLEINVISDGRQPETGALVVLQPYAPILENLGVTTTGPTATKTGEWTYHCIQYDAICDMVDPVVDPIGAAVRAVGYLTYHNGSDPVYNYGNKENLDSQSETIGNQTVVTYDAPNPVNRLVEQTIDSAVDSLTTSVSALVPAPAPMPAPEPVNQNVGTIPAPVVTPASAPAVAPTPAPVVAPAPVAYQAPEPVQQQVQHVWEQAAPIVEQVAPEHVQPIVDLANQFGIQLP